MSTEPSLIYYDVVAEVTRPVLAESAEAAAKLCANDLRNELAGTNWTPDQRRHQGIARPSVSTEPTPTPGSIYRIAWRVLNDEFNPGDDTYKGAAKDIHNEALDAGWIYLPDVAPDLTVDVCRVAAVAPAHPLSHYPFLTWNGAHHGVWMLHGHSHGLLTASSTTRMDVGVDTHPEMRPFSLDEVIETMAERVYVPVDAHGSADSPIGTLTNTGDN